MKQVFVIAGLCLLLVPLVNYFSQLEEIQNLNRAINAPAIFFMIHKGLFCGFAGIMIIGLVCDGGRGFQNKLLWACLVALGAAWCYFYPSGWLLGLPLLLYVFFKLLPVRRPRAHQKRD